MESFKSNTTNMSPAASLCHESKASSNEKMYNSDFSINFELAHQILQLNLHEYNTEIIEKALNDSTNNIDIQSDCSTAGLNTNSECENSSVFHSFEVAPSTQGSNVLSVTIPETESESVTGSEDYSVIKSNTGNDCDNNVFSKSQGISSRQPVPSQQCFNQGSDLHGAAENITDTSTAFNDASKYIMTDETVGSTKKHDFEEFACFRRNIAIKTNQESTPLHHRRDKIYTEICRNLNESVDCSDASIGCNGSSVTTRFGRVVRQRMQLNLDRVESSSEDEDYAPYTNNSCRPRRKCYDPYSAFAPNALVYLNLSKDIIANYTLDPGNNLVDNDKEFLQRLQKNLKTAKRGRKLFTPSYIEDGNTCNGDHIDNSSLAITTPMKEQSTTLAYRRCNDAFTAANVSPPKLPKVLTLIHKNLQAINARSFSNNQKAADQLNASNGIHTYTNCDCDLNVVKYLVQHEHKYDFIKSLDVNTPPFMSHPMALPYANNFTPQKIKTQLTTILYDLYNHKVFNCVLDARIVWKKMVKKKSFCCNTIHAPHGRQATIELSETLVCSAKFLSTLLIHEMCHAAAWLLNGEYGHGNYCKQWLYRAKQILPDLTINIDNCGRPPHVYKYTCTLCTTSSYGSLILKTISEERLRCAYCLGAIVAETYKCDKQHPLTTVSFTAKKVSSGFARFVMANYMQLVNDGPIPTTHTTIMRILSDRYEQGSNETNTL